jgi:hypothetical protein
MQGKEGEIRETMLGRLRRERSPDSRAAARHGRQDLRDSVSLMLFHW